MNQNAPHPAKLRGLRAPVALPSRFPLWSLVTITVLLALDALADLTAFGGPLHVAAEAGVAVTAAGSILVLWRRFAREKADVQRQTLALEARVRAAEDCLEASRAEVGRLREDAKRATTGLASVVDRTFAAWKLSPVEIEIGFMLLKGFSHKEIAELRGTSERTVREQAGAIYRKAGLGGRAELSAWFLEDLLPGRDTDIT